MRLPNGASPSASVSMRSHISVIFRSYLRKRMAISCPKIKYKSPNHRHFPSNTLRIWYLRIMRKETKKNPKRILYSWNARKYVDTNVMSPVPI